MKVRGKELEIGDVLVCECICKGLRCDGKKRFTVVEVNDDEIKLSLIDSLPSNDNLFSIDDKGENVIYKNRWNLTLPIMSVKKDTKEGEKTAHIYLRFQEIVKKIKDAKINPEIFSKIIKENKEKTEILNVIMESQQFKYKDEKMAAIFEALGIETTQENIVLSTIILSYFEQEQFTDSLIDILTIPPMDFLSSLSPFSSGSKYSC